MQFFPGRPRSIPLWQVQSNHDVHNGVGYMMNSMVKDVLPKFREGSAVTLEIFYRVLCTLLYEYKSHKQTCIQQASSRESKHRQEIIHRVLCPLLV